MNRFYEIFLITGTAWTVLVMMRYILPRNRKSAESTYAFVIKVIFLFSILDNLLRPNIIPMRYLDYIYPLTRLSYYLVGPVLLLYTQKLIEENFKLKWKHILHLIPFIIMFIYVTIDPQSLHPEKPFGMVDELNRLRDQSPMFSMKYVWLLSKNISRLVYSLFIVFLIDKNYTKLPEFVSNFNNRNTLSWLKVLITCYAGIYLFGTVIQLFVPEELFFTEVTAAVTRNLPPVLFIFSFSLFSDNQPIITPLPESTNIENVKKYEKSGITEDDSKEIYSELCDMIEDKKLYLEPELTLPMLADESGFSRHKLSEVINRESGKKFYTFINEFRLKEFEHSVKRKPLPGVYNNSYCI